MDYKELFSKTPPTRLFLRRRCPVAQGCWHPRYISSLMAFLSDGS